MTCALAIRLFIRRKGRGYLIFRKSHWGHFPHCIYGERGHLIHYQPIDPRHKVCPPPLFKGRVRWGHESLAYGFVPLE